MICLRMLTSIGVVLVAGVAAYAENPSCRQTTSDEVELREAAAYATHDQDVKKDDVEQVALSFLQSELSMPAHLRAPGAAPPAPLLPYAALPAVGAPGGGRRRDVATSVPLLVLLLGVVWLLSLTMIDLGSHQATKDGKQPPPTPQGRDEGGGRAPRSAGQLLLDADILCLVLAGLLNGGGACMFLPQLPRMEVAYGANKFEVSLLMVCYGCGGVLSSPLLGHLVDRHGGKPVLVRAMLLSSASFVVCGLMRTLWQLLVARVFAGFFVSIHGVLSALAAERTLPQERAMALALIGSGNAVGACAVPALSGLVSTGDHDHGVLCFGFAVACLASALWAMLLQRSPPRAKEQAASALLASSATGWDMMRHRPALLVWFLLYGVQFFALPMTLNAGSFLFHDLYNASEADIGLSSLLGGAGIAFAAVLLMGPTVSRLGERWTLVAAMALFAGATVVMPVMPGLLSAYAMTFVGSGLSAFIEPCIISSVSDAIPHNYLGTATGVFSALKSLGFVFGVIGASVLYQISKWVPYVLAANVQGMGVAMVFVIMLGDRGPAAAAPPA